MAAIIGMFGRQAGGRGQHIDMSKQEAHATLARIAIGLWAQTGFVETRATRDIPYGGCVPCKDGHVEILFHIADHHWDSLVEMIGNPEWAADPKFKDQEGRSANGAEANGHLFAWAKDRTNGRSMAWVSNTGSLVGFSSLRLRLSNRARSASGGSSWKPSTSRSKG